MYKKIINSVGIISIATLLVLVNITSPTSGGPVVIFGVFLLIYLFFMAVLSNILYYVPLLFKRIQKALRIKSKKSNLDFKKAYYFGSVIALGPVILIALNSVGSLGLYEIILTVLFISLCCFYVAKR